MSKLKSFAVTLQPIVDPGDATWAYQIPNLPAPARTNAANLIKCVSVLSSDSKQGIVLRFEDVPSNRVTRAEPLDKLLLLSFADFRLRWPSQSQDEPSCFATMKENGMSAERTISTGKNLPYTTTRRLHNPATDRRYCSERCRLQLLWPFKQPTQVTVLFHVCSVQGRNRSQDRGHGRLVQAEICREKGLKNRSIIFQCRAGTRASSGTM